MVTVIRKFLLYFITLIIIPNAIGKELNPGDRIPPPPIEGNLWKYRTLNKYECKNVSILDADTIVADVYIKEFGVLLLEQHIRGLGYDACETSKRRESVVVTDKEVEKGKKAKQVAEDYLTMYSVYIAPQGKDVYGRTLAYIYLADNKSNTLMATHKDMYVDLGDIIKSFGYDRSQLKDETAESPEKTK